MGTSTPTRFLPRELFFMLVGVLSAAGAGVVALRVLPEAMSGQGVTADELRFMSQIAVSRAFQVVTLAIGMVLVSAGAATRVTLGQDRATWFLAAGASVLFALLGFVAWATLDPAFAGVAAAGAGG